MSTPVNSRWFNTPAGAYPAAPPTPLTERFFDLAIDLLCIAGIDGYFKVLNHAWAETLGYEDGELLRRPFIEFVHPDDRAATVAEAAKLAEGFKLVHFRNRYRHKDGTYKWLAWTASPALNDGTIYATARNVTEDVVAEVEGELLREEQHARVLAVMAQDRVRPVFQPIVDLSTRAVRGFEALSRFENEPKRSPQQWFEDAGVAGLRSQLELHAIRQAIAHASQLPPSVFLSVNASPETLLSEDLRGAIRDLDGRRLVVEVTEHAAVEDYEPLQRAIDRLRRRGVRLAIDDAGAGFSSLKHIVRLLPEFIKLDLFLVRDIHLDPVKRAVVAGMLGVASQIGGKVIAEGVENREELDVLIDLGVEWAQGFYLGVPGPLTGRAAA